MERLHKTFNIIIRNKLENNLDAEAFQTILLLLQKELYYSTERYFAGNEKKNEKDQI